MIPKPRLRLLSRDGDADKAVITFFAPSGAAVKERLVMVSGLQSILNKHGRHNEMAYQVGKAIKEFGREVDMGFWI